MDHRNVERGEKCRLGQILPTSPMERQCRVRKAAEVDAEVCVSGRNKGEKVHAEMLHKQAQAFHKTSEREESEKCHHCCEPVGHGVVLELSASTGKGGGWEGFEG